MIIRRNTIAVAFNIREIEEAIVHYLYSLGVIDNKRYSIDLKKTSDNWYEACLEPQVND